MAAKTWGPFTGAQLTIMFVAAMAAIGLPGTLWAVAASNVQITDVANNHTAAVSVARRLFVTDTNLDQTLTPANYFRDSTYFGGTSGCVTLAVPPSGKASIVTDIRLDFDSNPTPGHNQYVAVYAGPACTGSWIGTVHPSTIGPYVIPLGPGVATTAGISVQAVGSVEAIALVDGYRVAATQVPGS